MLATSLPKLSALCASLLVCAPFANAQDDSSNRLSAADLADMRGAYDANRHTIHEGKNGFVSRNPEQAWRLSFDTRGCLVQPDSRDWTWGLELVNYGFDSAKQFVGNIACASANGGRVAYSWNDGLEEWYINDTRGFEHGFTVHERPAGNAETRGPLTLELQVRGNLTPQVHSSRRGITFVDQSGGAVLNYAGLTVFDAKGEALEAWFECSEGAVTFRIDEVGAEYPLTIDPVAQEAYLKASNSNTADYFGVSVDVSGDTIIVGAQWEDGNATGVNGNESNNSDGIAGAAYVFKRNGSSWNQEAYLKASNTNPGDMFGSSVGISGDTIVVGAQWEDSNTSGVDGNESNNSALRAGAAYVFVRSGTVWSQEAYLKPSNTDADDYFGSSVDVAGNTIVIGAWREHSNAMGVNGNESDNSTTRAGAAYVFVRNGTSWSQEAYLKPSSTDFGDHFGRSVGVSGDTVVVGASGEAGNATGVNGAQNNASGTNTGAAYVFVRNGTAWIQEAYLKASNPAATDLFGWSIGISQDTIVVGAWGESSNATGTNGDQSNNSAGGAGAAYVFTRSGTSWSQEAYLKASNTESSAFFGSSVSVSGNTILVGAVGEHSDATGVNGTGSNNPSSDVGAAYAFTRSGTNWSQKAYLKASNSDAQDEFGKSVGVSGDSIVVGAPGEGSNSDGVNGNQSINSASAAGAAYVFDLDFNFPVLPPTGIDLCSGDGGDQAGCTDCPCGNNGSSGIVGGCLNSTSTSATLEALGSASVSLLSGDLTDLRFALSGAPSNAVCILSSGDGVAPAGMVNACFGLNSGVQSLAFDGLRCAVLNTRRHGERHTDSSGNVGGTNPPWGGEGGPPVGLAVAGGGFTSGQTRYFQVIYRDDPLLSCTRGLNTSQAIEITFEP